MRYGGLGLPILSHIAKEEFEVSLQVTGSLVAKMKGTSSDELEEMSGTMVTVQTSKAEKYKAQYKALFEASGPKFARVLEQARERGSSNWLTALPLKKYGFSLKKGQFSDSLLLRYGKDLPRLPESCACGVKMTINHALNCPRGGYIIITHNSVRDFLANQLSKICKDVDVEPTLQQLEGETFTRRGTLTGEHARPDIRARGFHREGQHAFLI